MQAHGALEDNPSKLPIAKLWYYHISFIMVQPHCCMAMLDIRLWHPPFFSETSVIWINSKVVFIVAQLWQGCVMVMREPGVLGQGQVWGLMCDVGVHLFVLLAVIRLHPSHPSSPQLWPCVMTVATVVLFWWEKLELTFVPKNTKNIFF